MSFPTNSRYQATETGKLVLPGGSEVAFLRRRFVPHPEGLALMQEHAVVEGDRLDNLAARYMGDAELFWRICDAHRVMHPEELTGTLGRRLRMTLPDGVPGTPGVPGV